MQLITALSAASALVATASARSAISLNKECDKSKPYARIVNRCAYPVNLWSVFRGDGCPSDEMLTLNPGEEYSENYQDPVNGIGVSIKVSKTESCKANDIVQLEYYIEREKPDFNFNYLDVSYVDCLGNDCPTKSEGYYLKSGTQTGKFKSSAANTWCPILACNDPDSCAAISYILPDDVQTKTCDPDQNMDFYMCGDYAPEDDDSYEAAPASSSSAKKSSSAAKPTSTETETEESYDAVKIAAVTPAPEPQVAQESRIKTEVVYVTEYQYVNAKRHDHANAHARRHQAFHA